MADAYDAVVAPVGPGGSVEPVVLVVPGRVSEVRDYLRRNPELVVGTVIVVVLLLIGIVGPF
jgi:hypothetical protein